MLQDPQVVNMVSERCLESGRNIVSRTTFSEKEANDHTFGAFLCHLKMPTVQPDVKVGPLH
jgi:hypothetical protein